MQVPDTTKTSVDMKCKISAIGKQLRLPFQKSDSRANEVRSTRAGAFRYIRVNVGQVMKAYCQSRELIKSRDVAFLSEQVKTITHAYPGEQTQVYQSGLK